MAELESRTPTLAHNGSAQDAEHTTSIDHEKTMMADDGGKVEPAELEKGPADAAPVDESKIVTGKKLAIIFRYVLVFFHINHSLKRLL
jgi:hypothetical protein